VLQHNDYVELCSTHYACAALRQSGHMVAWGDPERGGKLLQGQEHLDDIVQIIGNSGSFIALRDLGDGKSVIGWGVAGQVPDHIVARTDIRHLAAAAATSFCIILETGEVKAWPSSQSGGNIPEEIARLTNVVAVAATASAYCAQLENGKVAAWGDETYGGRLSPEAEDRSDIVQVVSNLGAFAVLCSDGTVVAWGRDDCGGDTSAVADRLTDVRAIYATSCAFAALTADGRVVTWGAPQGGGNSNAVQPDLTRRVTTGHLLTAEEATSVLQGRLG